MTPQEVIEKVLTDGAAPNPAQLARAVVGALTDKGWSLVRTDPRTWQEDH